MSLVFVHGLGQNSESWNETITKIDNSEPIFKVDLMGLLYDQEITYQKLYKCFLEYCNAIEGEISLIGLSLGGVLALNYALEYPNKVKSLVLIASLYKMPTKLLKVQNFIFKLMPKKTFKEMKISKNEVIQLTTSMFDLDFEKDLYKIKAHTLIICGEKDVFNLKASKKLEEKIANSILKIIDNCKHEINIDKPVELGNIINNFLN